MRPLLDRLDRLERDMNQLQRQVYRGGSGGAPVPVAPADNPAVNAELRMDQLEDRMRSITGTQEEITYSIDQLKSRLDKLQSDIEMRLTALEHGTPSGGPAASNIPAPAGPAGAGANPAEPPSQSGVLAVPGKGGGKPGPAQGAQGGAQSGSPGAPQGASGQLPTGTAQEQYNYAFGLLRQQDFPGAEAAFRSFLQRYPNDALAGNAQYWLGETYYVRQDYNNATSAFAEVYRKYPQSGKGPDSLLKLGMSLGNLGQKKEACLSLSQLNKAYPTAPATVKERATQEQQHLGC